MQLVFGKPKEPDVLVGWLVLLAKSDDEIRRALLTSLAVLEHAKSGVRETLAVSGDLRSRKSHTPVSYRKLTRPLIHALQYLVRSLTTIEYIPVELDVVDHVEHHQPRLRLLDNLLDLPRLVAMDIENPDA